MRPLASWFVLSIFPPPLLLLCVERVIFGTNVPAVTTRAATSSGTAPQFRPDQLNVMVLDLGVQVESVRGPCFLHRDAFNPLNKRQWTLYMNVYECVEHYGCCSQEHRRVIHTATGLEMKVYFVVFYYIVGHCQWFDSASQTVFGRFNVTVLNKVGLTDFSSCL